MFVCSTLFFVQCMQRTSTGSVLMFRLSAGIYVEFITNFYLVVRTACSKTPIRIDFLILKYIDNFCFVAFDPHCRMLSLCATSRHSLSARLDTIGHTLLQEWTGVAIEWIKYFPRCELVHLLMMSRGHWQTIYATPSQMWMKRTLSYIGIGFLFFNCIFQRTI